MYLDPLVDFLNMARIQENTHRLVCTRTVEVTTIFATPKLVAATSKVRKIFFIQIEWRFSKACRTKLLRQCHQVQPVKYPTENLHEDLCDTVIKLRASLASGKLSSSDFVPSLINSWYVLPSTQRAAKEPFHPWLVKKHFLCFVQRAKPPSSWVSHPPHCTIFLELVGVGNPYQRISSQTYKHVETKSLKLE